MKKLSAAAILSISFILCLSTPKSYAQGANLYGESNGAAGWASGVGGYGSVTAQAASYGLALGYSNEVHQGFGFSFGFDNTSIGYGGFTQGVKAQAHGSWSTAMGYEAKTYGFGSWAQGYQTESHGDWAQVSGYLAKAYGLGSYSRGNLSEAFGPWSLSMGLHTQAWTPYEMVVGAYNHIWGDPAVWVATDPLFTIGNGSSHTVRRNAMVVLKNGAVLIKPAGDLSMGTFTAGIKPDSSVP